MLGLEGSHDVAHRVGSSGDLCTSHTHLIVGLDSPDAHGAPCAAGVHADVRELRTIVSGVANPMSKSRQNNRDVGILVLQSDL